MIRVIAWLLDLLYPPRCVICDKLLGNNETDFCTACRVQLGTMTSEPRYGEFFGSCISALPYRDTVRESLLRYKFYGCSQYAPAYGRLLAMTVQGTLAGQFDLISWVPVSRRRKRRRTCDQAQLLAAATAKELGFPLVQTLRKKRNNPAQSGISGAAARRGNVKGVYEPVQPERFLGKRILLIDDIITTGATLSEASCTLLTAGAGQVDCAVFAATDSNTSR